ncbi:MAG: hypothetical protein ACRDV2_13670 [Actinomycetes bacterium]
MDAHSSPNPSREGVEFPLGKIYFQHTLNAAPPSLPTQVLLWARGLKENAKIRHEQSPAHGEAVVRAIRGHPPGDVLAHF